MADTVNLRLPLIAGNQAQKHVTANEAFQFLDALVQLSVIDERSAPPGAPAEGDRYIVGTGATADWLGQDQNIAYYINGAWEFFTSITGWIAYSQDLGGELVFNGTSWVNLFGQAEDGTAALPSYTFVTDPDTGMYRAGVDSLGFSTNGINRLTINTGSIVSSEDILAPVGSAASPSYTFSGDVDTGLYRSAANSLAIAANGVQQARFTSGGAIFPTLATFNNTVLISTTQPTFILEDTDAATDNKRWRIDNVDGLFSIKTRTDAGAFLDSAYQISRDALGTLVHTWEVQSGNNLTFNGNTLDLNGSGTTVADFNTTGAFAGLYLSGSNSSRLVLGNTTDTGYNIELSASYADEIFRIEVAATSKPIISAQGFSTPEKLIFYSDGTEKMRLYGQGVLVAKTAENINTPGIELVDYGAVNVTRDAGLPMTLNRQTNDGGLISFFAQNTFEGNITVSGATVSYNNFLGSHYSELDGAPAELLKGTIVEATGNPVRDRFHRGERLTRFKVSDAAGSAAVYGVVGGASYEDEDFVDEEGRSLYPAAPSRSQRAMSEGRNPVRRQYHINALGASHVRIQAGQVIAVGDLIESAGDGTGRVQADDIIRSRTVCKITVPTPVDTYPDGSQLYPCVLYCG